MSTDHDQEKPPRTVVYRSPPGGRQSEEEKELTLVQLVNVLLRHRWKLLVPPLVLAVAVAAWTVVEPATYTARASFVPQAGGSGSGQLARLSGVASQFGINVPAAEAGQSPQFYADLLTSRRLLEEAVTHTYRKDRTAGEQGSSAAPTDSARPSSAIAGSRPETAESEKDTAGTTLVELYGVGSPSSPGAVVRATRRLEESLSVSANVETGVVELSVTTAWPSVSEQVADRLVELVNRFNNRVRQSQASAEAEFIRGRLEETEADLRAAEDSLEAFLQRNVGWQQSPELRFQHNRLERRVNLEQQVYTSLASRYEEAQIDEVRTTPVVTTVTEPKAPVHPDPARLPLRVFLAMVVGVLLGGTWAVGLELVRSLREENEEEYREFESLKKDAAEDVRRMTRRVRRLVGGDPPEA